MSMGLCILDQAGEARESELMARSRSPMFRSRVAIASARGQALEGAQAAAIAEP
eukprot:CAMPEP_0197879662 /NCGR_PEP_ID=MMETSP1439-20131203/7699_1 /TAXON_ID=66791 /ORGANISM="Gonyaulax spinifera, Strain CCMP409" /LENGTH=53 /DNA_ID=CAMNT_0043499185 /DNA_START=48 /DNA_END=206 /DNA_ORIENTATION=-